MADDLEQFLCTFDKAGMVNGPRQLNVAKMTRAFRHVFRASLALELSVDRAEEGIVETAIARLCSRLVHCFWVNDVSYAHRLDFLGRQETKLNLLDRPERRARVLKD